MLYKAVHSIKINSNAVQEFLRWRTEPNGEDVSLPVALRERFENHGGFYEAIGIPAFMAEILQLHPNDKEFDSSCAGWEKFLSMVGACDTEHLLDLLAADKVKVEHTVTVYCLAALRGGVSATVFQSILEEIQRAAKSNDMELLQNKVHQALKLCAVYEAALDDSSEAEKLRDGIAQTLQLSK